MTEQVRLVASSIMLILLLSSSLVVPDIKSARSQSPGNQDSITVTGVYLAVFENDGSPYNGYFQTLYITGSSSGSDSVTSIDVHLGGTDLGVPPLCCNFGPGGPWLADYTVLPFSIKSGQTYQVVVSVTLSNDEVFGASFQATAVTCDSVLACPGSTPITTTSIIATESGAVSASATTSASSGTCSVGTESSVAKDSSDSFYSFTLTLLPPAASNGLSCFIMLDESQQNKLFANSAAGLQAADFSLPQSSTCATCFAVSVGTTDIVDKNAVDLLDQLLSAPSFGVSISQNVASFGVINGLSITTAQAYSDRTLPNPPTLVSEVVNSYVTWISQTQGHLLTSTAITVDSQTYSPLYLAGQGQSIVLVIRGLTAPSSLTNEQTVGLSIQGDYAYIGPVAEAYLAGDLSTSCSGSSSACFLGYPNSFSVTSASNLNYGGSTPGIPEFPYQLATALIFVILVIGSYLLVTHRTPRAFLHPRP